MNFWSRRFRKIPKIFEKEARVTKVNIRDPWFNSIDIMSGPVPNWTETEQIWTNFGDNEFL